MADHTRAAANVAFGDRPTRGTIQSRYDMLGFYVEPIYITEHTIVSFGNNRHVPEDTWCDGINEPVHVLPGDNRIACHAYAVSIGQHHRTFQEARFFDPGCAGHFAVTVQRVPGSKDGGITPAPWKDGGDACAYGSIAHVQWSIAGNQCCKTNLNTSDIRDGIQMSGYTRKRNPNI